jgi:hypothetical protein
MIKLKDLLNEIQSKPLTVYHGTGSKFKKFDLKKTTQGIIWFTSDKNKILSNDAGAQGKGYLITAEVAINNPAGWDEYDKLGLGQIKGNGFDGVILKDADGQFDCFVFSPRQIKIIKSEKIPDHQLSEEDYKGQHLAPDKDGGAPLYDLTKIYPDDVYSSKAEQYYGDRSTEYSDAETVSIIQNARGPLNKNKQIKIYRAVPNINKETENKIKDISTVAGYIMKFGFLPVGSKYSDLYPELKYNKDALLEKLFAEMDMLRSKKLEGLKINPGDWVTINKRYAISHGRNTLMGDYKILTKTVPAKHLFTTGDSLHEFGYDPS